jgi:hypothetical protein
MPHTEPPKPKRRKAPSRSSKLYAKTCAFADCPRRGDPFITFRSDGRYCRDACRWAAVNFRKRGAPRQALIDAAGGKCVRCTPGNEADCWHDRLFVRDDPATGEKAIFCSVHFSEVSREKFRLRVPDARPGHKYRVAIANMIAREAAEA